MSLLLLVAGCSTHRSLFEIIDFRESGDAKRYQESFDEAYYEVDSQGNVDIVLRRREPGTSNPHVDITQVIHLHAVWRSVPGRTVAERTQINATVSYLIVSGRLGAAFEGAGSVFFKESRRKNTLEGTLDQALLKPTRRLAAGSDFFREAELSGKFHATRNRREVVRIINDMDRLFGPLETNSK